MASILNTRGTKRPKNRSEEDVAEHENTAKVINIHTDQKEEPVVPFDDSDRTFGKCGGLMPLLPEDLDTAVASSRVLPLQHMVRVCKTEAQRKDLAEIVKAHPFLLAQLTKSVNPYALS